MACHCNKQKDQYTRSALDDGENADDADDDESMMIDVTLLLLFEALSLSTNPCFSRDALHHHDTHPQTPKKFACTSHCLHWSGSLPAANTLMEK